MEIILLVVVWIISGVATKSKVVGFFLGVIAACLFVQERKIRQLSALVSKKRQEDLPAESKSFSSLPEIEAVPTAFQSSSQSHVSNSDLLPNSDSTKRTDNNPQSINLTPQLVTKSVAGPSWAPPARSFKSMIQDLFGQTVATFITEGNPIARVGVLILFLGVAFGLKFIAEQGYFPVELRLLLAAAGGFALLFLGKKCQGEKKLYGITLQGAGAGILYITTFVAFKLYHLMPTSLSFFILVGITAWVSTLSLRQDARSLAVLSLIGGFLAPVLTSDGSGSHLALFSYMTLLNIGILYMISLKPWKELSFVGMAFTFVLSVAWGAKYYTPQFFYSTEPFLAFFILLYIGHAILICRRNVSDLDASLVFAPPFIGSLLQYQMVANYKYGVAISAMVLGLMYLTLCRVLLKHRGEEYKLLTRAYYGIAIVLLSVAVPFAVSPHVTAAVWSIEAVGLLWFGIRQTHWFTRIVGQALLVLSTLFFLCDIPHQYNAPAFLNKYFLGIVILTFAYLFAAKLIEEAKTVLSDEEVTFGPLYAIAGVLWWSFGAGTECVRNIRDWFVWCKETLPLVSWYEPYFTCSCLSLFITISVGMLWMISERWKISIVTKIRFCHMPLQALMTMGMILIGLAQSNPLAHSPMEGIGFVCWLFVFAVHYHICFHQERVHGTTDTASLHIVSLLLITVLATWELHHYVDHIQYGYTGISNTSWGDAILILVPALIVFEVLKQNSRKTLWPFSTNHNYYAQALCVHEWWLFTIPLLFDVTLRGDVAPFPYIPILNPLDLAQAAALFVLIMYWRLSATLPKKLISLSLWSLIWATTIVLRSVHHYAGVSWSFDDLYNSVIAQTALSVFWSALALIVMVMAHRRKIRLLWQAGAVLITIVVVKLFAIDLAQQGTGGRIFAFLIVGLVMLAIGYGAPIPPRSENNS